MLIAAVVVALIGIAATVFSVLQARRAATARSAAERAVGAAVLARDEARRAAQQVADELQRLAATAQPAASMAPPRRETAFALHHTSKRGYRVLNTGVTVDRALVVGLDGAVNVEDPRPRRLEPGDSIRFSLPRTRGALPRVAITGVVTAADGSTTPFRTELAL